jgi:hypothetical protein
MIHVYTAFEKKKKKSPFCSPVKKEVYFYFQKKRNNIVFAKNGRNYVTQLCEPKKTQKYNTRLDLITPICVSTRIIVKLFIVCTEEK